MLYALGVEAFIPADLNSNPPNHENATKRWEASGKLKDSVK